MSEDKKDTAIICIRRIDKDSEYESPIAMIHDLMKLFLTTEDNASIQEDISKKWTGWRTHRISDSLFCRVIIADGIIKKFVIYHVWK